ncbi:hypothetical protein QOZ80_5BG0430320 [Eleusine coracana subsp. coracana]|nr:hypothetical protein QOZ80_5BG0430320 [Eleusine coracana subsp. coracana]
MSQETFLPDDLIIEILARLPARSLYTCMCVSKSWHGLISDPANRHRLAQTVSGLFFSKFRRNGRPAFFFAGLPSPPPPPVDPVFSFLPSSYTEIQLLDSCNGLFLFWCSLSTWFDSNHRHPPRFHVVCNPTTEWVALPRPSHAPGLPSFWDELNPETDTSKAVLAFDPAISPHFHVFQMVQKQEQTNLRLDAVEIYSSQTGNWVFRKANLDECDGWVDFTGSTAYFNGLMYFTIIDHKVASVDTTGHTWRLTTVVPNRVDFYASRPNAIGRCQGRLLYVDDGVIEDHALLIYALQDDKEWILKQRVSTLDLFGPKLLSRRQICTVAAFHPDCDLIILFDRPRKRLVSYDMTHRHMYVICTLEELPSVLGRPFIPYVPLFSGALVASSKVK